MTGVAVVGDVVNDVIVRPAGATAVDSDTAADIMPVPGGSGANQAAWLAALGVPVRLAARVGAADAGFHHQVLAAAGVEPRLTIDPERATGFIVVLVGADGTRSMYTDRGANSGLDQLDLDLLAGRSHLHVSGYALIKAASRLAVDVLWRAAGRSGLTRSVDAASAAFLSDAGPAFLDWTEGADVVFANLAEGRVIAGGTGGSGGAHGVAARLLERYPVVVVKLGSDGALVATQSATVECPPPKGPVVDPTGAGDAFCAGFLSRWLDGADLDVAGSAATAASAAAMSVIGGRPSPVLVSATAAADSAAAAMAASVVGGPAPASPARPEGVSWERLRDAARQVSANAHAPYSGLRVGAAGITDDGRLVAGCNVENASFGLSLCAECGLVSALRAASSDRLLALSVVAHDGEPLTPCGRCRQLLWDNGGPEMLIDRGSHAPPARLRDLLPGPFNSEELARRRGP